MSQPTLSRRLRELERHIGAPLFYRASSGVSLTQEGEELRHIESLGAVEITRQEYERRLERALALPRTFS